MAKKKTTDPSALKMRVAVIEGKEKMQEKWMEVIQYLVDNGFAANGKIRTARMGLEWWVSKKPFEKFYADEYQQQKIDFTTKQETWD